MEDTYSAELGIARVRALHAPERELDGGYLCRECRDEDGGRVEWPCATSLATGVTVS